MEKGFLAILIFVIYLSYACDSTEPLVNNGKADEWRSVSGLEHLDVRYMIEFNDMLYLSANDPTKRHGEKGRGVIYKTSDGKSWNLDKSFNQIIGPLAINEDTLYVLLADSIYAFNKNKGWWSKYKTPPGMADPNFVGDIVFYNGNFFGMLSYFNNVSKTWCIYPNGEFEEKKVYPLYPRSYAGAKFCKVIENGIEKIYVRPHWEIGSFFQFDGEKFIVKTDGLTEEEISYREAPPNSMIAFRNQLYAGFLNPATVKTLVNDAWVTVTDSLPYSESAYKLKPIIKTQTTGIAFAGDRLFVSTQIIGVLEWVNSAWKRLPTSGLPVGCINGLPDLYMPIPIFHSFKGKLIVAYGKPGYAPYQNDVFGVYFYEL